MSRLFAYCRVSTVEQTTENQIIAMAAAGYSPEPQRIFTETISGSVITRNRPVFTDMLKKMESGDKLVVLKLDRLGRDSIDVQQTVDMLIDELSITPIVLDLPVHDLSSSQGKLMLQLFSAFAEFERNRIRERTAEGLERAKAQGKQLGRKAGTNASDSVQELQRQGLTQKIVALRLGISIPTVKRHWDSDIKKEVAQKKAEGFTQNA